VAPEVLVAKRFPVETQNQELCKILEDMGKEEEMEAPTCPTLNFQSLGYGYCPGSDLLKFTNLLGSAIQMQVIISFNSTFCN